MSKKLGKVTWGDSEKNTIVIEKPVSFSWETRTDPEVGGCDDIKRMLQSYLPDSFIADVVIESPIVFSSFSYELHKVHTLLLTLLDETFGNTHYYRFKNAKLIDVHKRAYDGGPTQWRAVFTGKIEDITCGKL